MDDHEEHIRRLAYHPWEEAGWPEGRSDEFWYAALAVAKGDNRRVGDFFRGSIFPSPDGRD
jgi:hypothetical protein